MMRFNGVVLVLILAGYAAQASTPIASNFRSFSKAEATELQHKLAALPPAEFLNQLQSQTLPGQPPLWLGPFTEPVVVDTFGLLSPERAAELLPVLWELNDRIIPEEKVLFAAACFQALPEREKHPEFARRLDRELKALLAAPSPLGDRDGPNRSLFVSRAVGALAGMWEGNDEEREWILMEANNPQMDPDVRGSLIDKIAEVLCSRKQDAPTTLPDRSFPNGVRWRQMFLPWPACERLQKQWGNYDWKDKLLFPIAQSPMHPQDVRVSVIMALQRILGRDENVKTMLLETAASDVNPSRIRRVAIRSVARTWGPDEGLKKILTSMMMSPEESSAMRHEAISQLGHEWKENAAVRESLAAVVSMTDDHLPVQRAALEALVQMGRSDWLQHFLLKTAAQVKADWPLRKKAVAALGAGVEFDPAARAFLLNLAKDRQELLSLRIAAIGSLAGATKKDEQIKQEITGLMLSAEENEKVRIECFGALGLVWERKNNEWVKDLLMPLVSPQEKCVALRAHILGYMPQIWHREAWLEELFKGLAASPNEPDEIRSIVIRASYNGNWRKEDWFKEWLAEVIRHPEQSQKVRHEAAQALTQIWRAEPWVVDLLLQIASSAKESPEFRQQVIMTLGGISRQDRRFQDLLMAIAADSREAPKVRWRAIFTLKLDAAEVKLLMRIAGTPGENLLVREGAIEMVGRAWGPLTWKERGEFLAALAGPMEASEQIRTEAALQLALIRESMGFGN